MNPLPRARKILFGIVLLFFILSGFFYIGSTTGQVQGEQRVVLTPAASPVAKLFLPIVSNSYPFSKTGISPFYLQNFANNAGCNWMGIAGEVLDADHAPVFAGSYRVHIWGGGIDARVTVGSAPAYGPSGWEQFLFDSPIVRDYDLQLETNTGTAVSPIHHVRSRASCNQNLIRLDFIER